MAVAAIRFGPDHRQATITYDRKRLNDLPTDAINYTLEILYPDVLPYVYEVWRDGNFDGLLVSEFFDQIDDNDITLAYDIVIMSNQTQPETGDFTPKDIVV